MEDASYKFGFALMGLFLIFLLIGFTVSIKDTNRYVARSIKDTNRYVARCEALGGEVYIGKGIRLCVVDGKIVNLDRENKNADDSTRP